MNTTLVIMAAGLGTRFGHGIKQLTPVGPNGELIIDYSIHDALEAGFNKIVFVIRKNIEADFREVIGDRVAEKCEIAYVYQDIQDIPAPFTVPEGRTKPWGTGQAVLACRDVVKEPFAIINADDYYGKEAFVKLHDYLVEHAHTQCQYCMAGFILENTLSEHGGVTRGICNVNEQGKLAGVKETRHIMVTPEGITADGVVLDPKAHVSMNMWGVTPEFIQVLESGFEEFLNDLQDPMQGEFLLPIIMDHLIREHRVTVTVLETGEHWFGVTYKEDRPMVAKAFEALIAAGVYTSPL